MAGFFFSYDINVSYYFIKGGEYEPFEGCLSKVEVNGNPVDLANDVIKDGAVMSGCPEA